MRRKKYIRMEAVYFEEWIKALPTSHFTLLMVFVSILNRLGVKELQISCRELSEYSGISHPTLIKAIRNLEKHQLIHVKRKSAGHAGCIANSYSLKKVLANKKKKKYKSNVL